MPDLLNTVSFAQNATSDEEFYYITAHEVLIMVLDDLFKLNLFLSLCLGIATLFVTVFSAFVVALQHGRLAAFYPVFAEMVALKSLIREHETADDPDMLEDNESIELFKQLKHLREYFRKVYFWEKYCSTTVVQIAPLAAAIVGISVVYHLNFHSVMNPQILHGHLVRLASIAVFFLVLRFSREVRCTIFAALEARFSSLKEPLASYAECLLAEAAYSVRLLDAAALFCVFNMLIKILLLLAVIVNSGLVQRCIPLDQCTVFMLSIFG